MKDATKEMSQKIMNDLREWKVWQWGPFMAQSYSGATGRQWQISFSFAGLGVSLFYFDKNNNDGTPQTERT